MLTKTTIALTAALILGTGSLALAQSGEQKGGFRELGPGGASTGGINDVFHANSAAACKKAYPKSYDPSTMTYLGKDGKRHACP
jgi:BA14K-like protein